MLPIQLRGLTKRYGCTVAAEAVDLDIRAGEMFFVLGPSGCGKTTLLRLLAGLTWPTAGSIHFGDRDVTDWPANRREAAMVFQGYALWPHMTVAQNVAFGLKVRRLPRREVRRRVQEALEIVQLKTLAQRKPQELSGGQQQRVALARALVVEPKVLLLDEPLSNLDAQLRVQMRGQIRQICQQARITSVYVTHDQKEALSMADRVAVMQAGRVVQVGTPTQVYRQPRNRFVAEFIGDSTILPGRVVELQGQLLRLSTPLGTLASAWFPAGCETGQEVWCCLRPESVAVWDREASPPGPNQWLADVSAVMYLGEAARLELRTGEARVTALQTNPSALPALGAPVRATIDPRDLVVLIQ